ncbi:unnamed protein product [Owenia fusiformis]|uniref:Uncharacterized protein n=1 Tax=Owenia fusiformis TaxID=6347 RepID=A0A8S4PM52_OWEFU|nr:unnamed protein product [Owenia fusiformis]
MNLFQRKFGGVPLFVLLLAVLIFASIPQIESITSEEKTAVEKGLETGKEVLDIIKSKEFTKALTKIAASIGPFLGALGPFVSIIMAFIPMGDSAELAFMKEMMKKIDNRFNQMDSRFDEIERLVDWTKVAVNFGQIEQKILAVDAVYERLYTSAANASQKGMMFTMNYESDYQNSGLKLYHAIVNRQGTFQENLGESVMRYTKNDRKKTQEFLLGVMRLLMQAAKLEIAYLTVYKYETMAKERVEIWEENIRIVKSNFEQIDLAVTKKYHDQSEVDIKKLTADNYGISNEQFSDKLYSMLIEKYYWRNWFVVVYKAITGGDNHYVRICNGHMLFRQDGRNIVVSSMDKNELGKYGGETTLNGAQTRLDATEDGNDPLILDITTTLEVAKHYFNMIDKIGACSVISIKKSADVWYKGDSNKIAYRKFHDYLHFILFDNYK